MRKTTIASLFGAAALLFSVPSFSQNIVYDPTSFGGILKQIYTEIQNHADNLSMSAEQIAAITKVFDETSKVAVNLENVYSDIQPVLQNTKILYNAGQSIQDNYRTMTWAYEKYAELFSEGEIDYNKFQAALRATNYTLQTLKEQYEMIQQCLQSKMTTKEKMEVIQEAQAKADLATSIRRREVQKQIDNMNRKYSNKYFNEMVFGKQGENASSKGGALLEAPVLTTDEYLQDADLTLEESTAKIRSSYQKLTDTVQLILAFLFVIATAWAVAKYFKGDRQNRDILLKVSGGLFFIIILLQVIKATLLT